MRRGAGYENESRAFRLALESSLQAGGDNFPKTSDFLLFNYLRVGPHSTR
jgi:hypothetical protein